MGGDLYFLAYGAPILHLVPFFLAALLLSSIALGAVLEKIDDRKRRILMATPSQIEFDEVEVISLVDGELLPAKLYMCPECEDANGPPLFTVFEIIGQEHFHLQCGYCDASFCTAVECKPPEKKIIIVPG